MNTIYKKYGTMNSSEYIQDYPFDTCCFGLFYKNFFQTETVYNQSCVNCGSEMFIGSISQRDLINPLEYSTDLTNIYEKYNDGFYKNYRNAKCLKCDKNFESNWKEKYYLAWGLFCYKVVNRYDKPF